jgi:hypothetical protein
LAILLSVYYNAEMNNSKIKLISLCLALIGSFSVNALAQETEAEPYYFYRGYDYGSESLVNPINIIVNGGFGIFQLAGRNNSLIDLDYTTGFDNLKYSLTHPFELIGDQGWSDFLISETVPISINRNNAQYWPNYTQHLIGGGMSYRLMYEWFDYHDFGHPKTYAVTTIFAYHFLNEVVESSGYGRPSTDPIADLYLFDPLSIVLFSNDKVCNFFSKTLNMAEWPYQPMIDPTDGTIANTGQNFVMKWKLPRSDKWSLFYHMGTHAELGLSRHLENDRCVSFGAGMKADNLIEVDEHSNTVNLALSGGIFYDRNNSLMASLLLAKSKDYKVRLNLYPGLVKFWGIKPGIFVGTDREDNLSFGINLSSIPIGISKNRQPN